MAIVINGSGTITGISAGGLPDSCVTDADIAGMAASKLTGALAAISGAALTGLSSGITMADQWGITNSHQLGSTAHIFTSNWARNPNSTYGQIGTGMTESSGVFTFPSTGIYLIIGSFSFYSISSEIRYIGLRMQTSTDGMSSAINACDSYTSIGISTNFGAYGQVSDNILFDVTDTSTHKIRFVGTTNTSSASYIAGNSSGMGSGVTFIRLGDT